MPNALRRVAPLDGDYLSPVLVIEIAPPSRVAGDELGSWLSKRTGIHVRVGGSVGRALNNAGNAVVKAATDTGHVVGKIASNPIVQGVTAAALTLTGVGAPAAAAILAAEKGGGAILRPGGNIGQAARGAVSGAIEGGAAGLVGKALSPVVSRIPGASAVQRLGGAFQRAAAALPGTDVPAPRLPLPLDVDGNPAAYRPLPGTSIGNPFGIKPRDASPTSSPELTPASSSSSTTTGKDSDMSYDLLSHLIGTDRAKALTGAVTSVTQPVAAVVQRVAGPRVDLPNIPADVANAGNNAPLPGVNLPAIPSPADYANGMLKREGATPSGDPLALVKAHPVAAAAVAGGLLWLAIGRR